MTTGIIHTLVGTYVPHQEPHHPPALPRLGSAESATVKHYNAEVAH